MKWFKHMSNSSDDAFVEGLEDRFGWEGYGRWWKLLEVVARGMDKDAQPYAEHSWVKWQSLLKGKRSKLEAFFRHCEDEGKILISGSFPVHSDFISETNRKQTGNEPKTKPEQNRNILKITIPKLLELRDEYTRNSGAPQDNTPDKLPPKIIEVEVDTEKDTSTTLSAGARNLSAPVSEAAPPESKPPAGEPVAPPVVAQQVETVFAWLEEFFNSAKPYHSAPIAAWLAWGADFDLDIKPSAERFAKRGKGPPGTLAWLGEDVAKSIFLRTQPMPDVAADAIRAGPSYESREAKAIREAEEWAARKLKEYDAENKGENYATH